MGGQCIVTGGSVKSKCKSDFITELDQHLVYCGDINIIFYLINVFSVVFKKIFIYYVTTGVAI